MRLRSLVLAAVLPAAFLLSQPVPAQAQAGDAKVRIAHFSPDASSVDVYVDGKKKMNRVPFLAVSDYISLPAGKHTIEVRGEGTPETSPPIVSAAPELAAGKAYTAAAVGAVANIQGKVYEDDLTPPASGKSKIRVIHAADGTDTVDIGVKDGDVIFPGIGFGNITTYSEVAAGSYTLQVLAAGTTNVVLEKPVTIQPGGVYTVAAVGGADKPVALRGFVDLSPGAAATSGGGATPASTAAGTATTVAAATETTAAATTETTAPAAPATTVAAATETTAAPATTKAPLVPTTLAAEVGGSNGSAGSGSTGSGSTGSGATPVGGANTGFGGLDGSDASMTLVALGAVLVGAVASGTARRRRSR